MLGRKEQELTDDEWMDWAASRIRSLTIGIAALIIGGILVVVLFVINDRIRADRTEQRDRQARQQACATIYDAKPGNPYVQELIEDHPACARRARADHRPSMSTSVPSKVPAPAKTVQAGGSQNDSPVTPTQVPTNRAVSPPSAATRTPPATNAAPAPSKNAARTPSGDTSGVSRPSSSPSATTRAPLLCATLGLGGLVGVTVGCN